MGKNLGGSEMINGILGEFTGVKVSTCVLLKNLQFWRMAFSLSLLVLGTTLTANELSSYVRPGKAHVPQARVELWSFAP